MPSISGNQKNSAQPLRKKDFWRTDDQHAVGLRQNERGHVHAAYGFQ